MLVTQLKDIKEQVRNQFSQEQIPYNCKEISLPNILSSLQAAQKICIKRFIN